MATRKRRRSRKNAHGRTPAEAATYERNARAKRALIREYFGKAQTRLF